VIAQTPVRRFDLLGVAAENRRLVRRAGSTVSSSPPCGLCRCAARAPLPTGGTYADHLRGFGAEVTAHDQGMLGSVCEIAVRISKSRAGPV